MSADHQVPEGPAEAARSEKAGLDFPLAVGAAAAEAWMNMGAEAVRFTLERLQQDIETQHALMGCKSLEDMRKIQAEFFAAARAQYAAEAGKMLALIGNVAAAGMVGATRARQYDDIPL